MRTYKDETHRQIKLQKMREYYQKKKILNQQIPFKILIENSKKTIYFN